MLTRAQLSTPKNPACPLYIYREGQQINNLINIQEHERAEFLSCMKSNTSNSSSDSCSGEDIATPAVKLIKNLDSNHNHILNNKKA